MSTGPRAATHSSVTCRLFGTSRSQRAAAAGISVRATNSAQSRAKLTVIASWLKKMPAKPEMKTTGRKTATVVSVPAAIAIATSLLPPIAAAVGRSPSWSRR